MLNVVRLIDPKMMNSFCKAIFFGLIVMLPLNLMAQSVDSDFKDKMSLDAAFKNELIALGFENGEYPTDQAVNTSDQSYKITGNLIHLAGTSALAPDGTVMQGRVEAGDTSPALVNASSLACAASINHLKNAAGGDLSLIRKVANIKYKTLTVPGYFDYVPTSNACSEMMVRVFGKTVGAHTRFAIGLFEEPNNETFQIEIVAYLK